ncbi:MAG: hypothetical protein HY531_01730 [Chloroflexi bacterium]|nr:hypothetical protein [Chloroflexota bacterium]
MKGVNIQQEPSAIPARNALHLKRRLFHMGAASVFPILAIFLPRGSFLWLLLVMTLLFVTGDLARLRVARLNRLFRRLLAPLLREREERRLTGASYVLLGTLAVFALFSPEVGILAVLFTALGDPVAAVVGRQSPGWRLRGKSPWGTAAMIGAGLATAGVLHAAGVIPFGWPVAVGALVAGFTELLPLPLDDNLRVPLAAAAAMTVLGL